MVMVGFRMIAVGLVTLITGEAGLGLKILKTAASVFSKLFKGEALVRKAATAFRVSKVMVRVLAVLGTVTDHEVPSWDIIEESKQCEQLGDAIKELCVARLQVKMTQNYSRTTLFFSADARATLDYANDLQDLVEEKDITQKKADEKVDDRINKWIPRLKESIDAITDESTYDDLKKLDSEHGISCTDEDSDYNYIIDKLKNL
ncbi:hypothetical protein AMATHDRAFT_7591 [Amanita thiersii Skay4041]|uniref:Uncharacterized protein n=1 Tax=Amanita thiersii Skay4041 TaxID=703135 RepID=A0A2A9NEC4_9AGAR|nr:hypothetical protein AMATHDRAFT_7591 [Amanita thiersii Skay4041]